MELFPPLKKNNEFLVRYTILKYGLGLHEKQSGKHELDKVFTRKNSILF